MGSMTTALKKATAGFALAAAAVGAHAGVNEAAGECVGLSPRAAQTCMEKEQAISIAESRDNTPYIETAAEILFGSLLVVSAIGTAYGVNRKKLKKSSLRVALPSATNYFTAPDVDAPVHDVPSYFAPKPQSAPAYFASAMSERPRVTIPVNARPKVVRPQRKARGVNSQSWPPFGPPQI